MRRLSILIPVLFATPLIAGDGLQSPMEQNQGRPPALRDVGFDQRLDEQVPLDVSLIDESGRDVTFGDYFAGKPVILVLAQYRCPMLCNQVLNGLVDALRKVAFTPGEQYQVVVVGFDARETPEMAAAKKATYVEHFARPGSEGGWHFLTGPKDSVDRIAKAVGFRYSYDAQTDLFAHASGVVVLTPQGKAARYFYGIRYSPRDLRLGLVEASQERIGSPVDQILLFCFHYDATAGKYSAAVRNFVRLGGVLMLLAIGAFMFQSWRRDRRATARTKAE